MNRANEIEEQAAKWIIRLEEKRTDAMRAQFDAWVSEDLRHRAAYLRLSAAWATTGRLQTLARPRGAIDPNILMPRRRTPPWMKPVVAAAAILVLGVGIAFFTWRNGSPATDVYRTAIGGYSRIVLVDGSTISLNTDSEVRVRLSSDIRHITLLRGEANFDVAHDVRRPFDVHVGANVIRAVGTSFDVRRRSAESVDVVVTEGKVSVRRDASAASDEVAPIHTALVGAGESARVGSYGVEVRRLDLTEAERHLSWRSGDLAFQGETLEEVVKEFNRYNRRQLQIADPSLRSIRVGGTFKGTDVDSFLAALRTSFGLVADSTPDGTLVIRRDSASPVSARPVVVTRQ